MFFLGWSLGSLSRFTKTLTYNVNFPYAVGKHQKEYGVDRRAENSVSLTTFAQLTACQSDKLKQCFPNLVRPYK